MQWGRNSLIEQAKVELEILEYQHPNRFKCLKQDLKAYISELESENQTSTASMSAATQESSNRNERCGLVSRLMMPEAAGGMKRRRRRCKTDAVLERAQQCLHKIQHFKTTLS